MYKKRLLVISVAASIMLPISPSYAQGLEEVLVTARKREESILKVPVSTTAFTGADLERLGTDDLYTLTERVPGFVMGTDTGAVGSTPSLRGVGTGTLNPTIDQSVSLNIDGVGFSQGLAFGTGMFDMRQLEVLRGPQSLFYGKNSTAGVISILTRDPGDEFELELTTAYEFEADEMVGELVISGPVTETLGLRLAARLSDMDGYFDNNAVGDGGTGFTPRPSRHPEREETFFRGTAVWQPTEGFRARLKVNQLKKDTEGHGGDQLVSCPDGTATPDLATTPTGGFIGQLYGTTSPGFIAAHERCKLDDRVNVVSVNPDHPLYTGIRNDGVPFSYLDLSFSSLELSYDIGDHLTLTSVTGYQQTAIETLINGGVTGHAGPLIMADSDFDRRDLTQELRLISNYDAVVNFAVGAYYQDGNMRNRTGLFFLGPLDQGALEIDVRTVALFGQTIFTLSPEWELSAGLRWTDEERELSAFNLTQGQPFAPSLYGNADKLATENVSPEIALTYTPTDNLTYFVSYREAFKSGSWDTISNPRGVDTSFGDENVKGYEGGIKARLLNNTLAVNFAGYSYKYDDLQVGSNQSTPTGFVIVTQNAAAADVYGVDLDLTYEPSQLPGLQLFGAFNWNRARYDEFSVAPCWGGQTAAEGCNQLFDPATGYYNAQDLSGGELLRAPDIQATFGFSYEWAVADGKLLASVGSSTLWSDKYATNALIRDDFFQDSYFKTSLNFGIRDARGAWELSLIGKNLNNEITAGACTNLNAAAANAPGTVITGSPTGERGIAGVDELSCIAERGREIWLSLKLRPMLFRR